jgi:type I restriction enzyme, S subunit
MTEGWKEVSLGQKCDFERGVEPGSSNYNTSGLGKRFLRVSDLTNSREEVLFTDIKTDKILKNKDICISLDGTVGIVRDDLEGIYSTGIRKVNFSENEFNRKFIYYILKSNKIQKIIKFHSSGSTILHAGKSINFFDINIPKSLPEQQKIADILTKVDETIEFTEKIIEKDERIKKGLMQDLFSAEKNIVSIDDITELVGSGVTPKGGYKVYVKSGTIFLRSQNIYPEGLKLTNVAHITKSINSIMKRTQTTDFDVLLNITGASIGRSTFIPENFPNANVNQHVCILRLKNKTKDDAFLLSSLLNSDLGQKQIIALNAGSNREGLNFQQTKSMEFPFPEDENKRKQIVSILSSIDSKIQKEKQELNKLKSIKEGLMQDLLTGNKQKEVTCMIKEAVA